MARITDGFDKLMDGLNREWKQLGTQSATQRAQCEIDLKERLTRALSKNGAMRQARLDRLEKEFQTSLDQRRSQATHNRQSIESTQGGQQQEIDNQYQSQWVAMESEWKSKAEALASRLHEVSSTSANLFPEWQPEWMTNWTPAQTFAGAARLGEVSVSALALAGTAPKDPRLALPGLAEFRIPLCLTFPGEGSLVIETADTGREQAVAALNNIVIRLLAAAPPGQLQFTLLDPVELGQSFAGIMHLADYEDRLINSRIWTQVNQIEEQLARLNEHIEKVAQMYLRNEYATIAEYNEQAGRIAEKYHFLVIADFPVNFSDLAARRLQSILASGPRCGVFTLIHHDSRRSMPTDFVTEEMHKNCVRLRVGKNGVFLGGEPIDGVTVSLDNPPSPELATPFLHMIGKASIDSNRVEVPFADVIPPENEFWSLTPRLNCGCPSAAPARPSCNTSRWAKAHANTRWSPARPVPASPRCSMC